MNETLERDNFILQILNLVATILSLIGSLVMTYYCFKNRDLSISIKLILALAVSDFLFSAGNFMAVFSPTPDSATCQVEGFFREFFPKLSVCIATSIAILHYKIIEANPNFNKNRFRGRVYRSIYLSEPCLFLQVASILY